MTAQEVEELNREHKNRIRRAFLWAYGLCVCAIIPLLFSMLGWFKPQAEPLGQWFQRSGAVMTVFAVYAQFKANSITAMIAGSGWGGPFALDPRYKGQQNVAAGLSLALVIIGTLVWGYGDLLFRLFRAG
jgi:hypothetical protein